MRFALIKQDTGIVENLIELDTNSTWPIPPGYEVVASKTADIGMIYTNGAFTAPVEP